VGKWILLWLWGEKEIGASSLEDLEKVPSLSAWASGRQEKRDPGGKGYLKTVKKNYF